MTEDSSEISLFDMADWLWSFRWLMLACLAIAAGWALFAWQNIKDPAPLYEVKLQVFSGGTPVRGTAEIVDILVAQLEDPGLEQVSAPAANPVVYRTSDSQLASRVEAGAAPVTEALLEEVRSQETELKRLLRTNENALPLYLKTKAFIEGVNSGLVSLVMTTVITVTPNTASGRSRTLALLIPLMASGFLFLVIAGSV